jgi:hypothetical protein
LAAYATQQREPSARGHSASSNRLELSLTQAISGEICSRPRGAADAAVDLAILITVCLTAHARRWRYLRRCDL